MKKLAILLIGCAAILMGQSHPETFTVGVGQTIAAFTPVSLLSGTSTIDDLAATSPFGQFAVKQLGFGAEMNGVVTDGRLRETFSFMPFTTPSCCPDGAVRTTSMAGVPPSAEAGTLIVSFRPVKA